MVASERRLAAVEEENRRLNESLQIFLEEYNQLRASQGGPVSVLVVKYATHQR
jgi:hypothetical protein